MLEMSLISKGNCIVFVVCVSRYSMSFCRSETRFCDGRVVQTDILYSLTHDDKKGYVTPHMTFLFFYIKVLLVCKYLAYFIYLFFA